MAFDLAGKAVKNLTLYTTTCNGAPIKIAPAKTGDADSRYFVATFRDDRGVIDVSAYDKVMLNATLPDGTKQQTDGEINADDNTVTVKLTSSMVAQEGKTVCDITLSGESEAKQLTSVNFYVVVSEGQASDESIEGTDEYSTLNLLIASAETAISNAESATESANEAATTANAAAENADTATSNAESATVAAEEATVAANEAAATATAAAEEATTAAENATTATSEANAATSNAEVATEAANAAASAANTAASNADASAESADEAAANTTAAIEEANALAVTLQTLIDTYTDTPCTSKLNGEDGDTIVSLIWVEV